MRWGTRQGFVLVPYPDYEWQKKNSLYHQRTGRLRLQMSLEYNLYHPSALDWRTARVSREAYLASICGAAFPLAIGEYT
jgi:hypothetical protein